MAKPDIRLNLVEDAYRAAAGQDSWEKCVNNFSHFSAVRSAFVGHDRTYTDISAFVSCNYDPDFIDVFEKYYCTINPWGELVNTLAHMPQGGWGHDYVSMNDLRNTEFYEDWVKPQGDIATGVGFNFINEDQRYISLLCNVSFEHIEQAQKVQRIVLDVGDHIRRALELQKQLEGQKLRLNSYEQVLDSLQSAVILTDDRARVSFANRKAEEILRSGHIVRLGNGSKLRFVNPEHKRSIEQGLSGLRLHASGETPFSIPLELGDNNKLLLFVSPVLFEPAETADLVMFWRAPRQYAWFFISPDERPNSKIEIVSTVLQVSSAEAELALSLLHDKPLKQHAEERGTSKNTARVQMQSLLNKTDCRRQSELVGKLNRLFGQINI